MMIDSTTSGGGMGESFVSEQTVGVDPNVTHERVYAVS